MIKISVLRHGGASVGVKTIVETKRAVRLEVIDPDGRRGARAWFPKIALDIEPPDGAARATVAPWFGRQLSTDQEAMFSTPAPDTYPDLF